MLGLPQADDDDDDNHLCIKCNSTIIGLDNYVKHRKALCGKTKLTLPSDLNISSDNLDHIKTDDSKNLSDPNVEPFREEYQYNHGADVFFQSLELQSSSKRPPTATAIPIASGSKGGVGVLTRRATAAMIATTITKDIFSSAHTSSNVVSEKRGGDWIGGHNLRVMETDDNETKFIKAIANISESGKKHHVPSSFDLIDDLRQDDDSNDDSDELDDIEDDDNHPTGGKWKPMSSHGGDKWKPIYSTRDTTTHWAPSSAITPDPDHHEDWDEEHTGGKWKLFMTQSVENLTRLDKIHEMDDEEEDAYMPPPGHTKGKWIPGAKDVHKNDQKAQIMDATALHKEGGSTQFWCGPCNRRLGSKNIYERHLLSNLHLKRTLPEKELEFSGAFKSTRLLDMDIGKRVIKPSSYLDETIYVPTRKLKTSNMENEDIQPTKKKRKRRPTFIHCAICKYKVKPFLMGKHLISHYHFRKADINDELNKPQILENIQRIVRQSPFQCSPCKFYVNWQSDFLRHWKSQEHKSVVDKMPGVHWCSFCKFECEESVEMEEHLIGEEHEEVVAAINRSMPIVIRKKSVIRCMHCYKVFRYNFQLKRHNNTQFCPNFSSTASDDYQGRVKCKNCDFSCKSRTGLARHLKERHGRKMYFCSACSIEFENSIQAKTHRSLQCHRIKEKEFRRVKGFFVKDISKACAHCDAPKFNNIIELKEHIKEKHKNVFTSCPQCGMQFTLPQEVSWHIRNKACSFKSDVISNFSGVQDIWNCRVCPFVTESHAECIFHEVLHGEPVLDTDSTSKRDKSQLKYACPVCHKIFLKPSLRCHLRQHTNERPFVCDVCNSTFSRKSNLVFHVKRIHTNPQVNSEPETLPADVSEDQTIPSTSKLFLCSVCGMGFGKKYNLKQHITRHVGRAHACPQSGCPHAARSASELRAHLSTHMDTRPHPCNLCSYRAKTKHQLTRHLKVHSEDREKKAPCPHCPFRAESAARLRRHLMAHSGIKPYGCPHCNFMCNNLENLRKHVLSRNKHKGKELYECQQCLPPDCFSTNFSKLFRVHLVTAHPDIYPDHKSTAQYVADFLKVVETSIEEPRGELNINGMKFDINELTVQYIDDFQDNNQASKDSFPEVGGPPCTILEYP